MVFVTSKNIPPMKLEYPIPKAVSDAFRFKVVMLPSEWAVKKFSLGKGYGESGAISFEGRKWQIGIVDAYAKYKNVMVCGPVQVGKSIAGADIPWAWWNDNVGGHSLIVYADKDTVKDVFEERIKPSVKENLRHLWSGNEDDLRQEKMILNNGITRCASANVENDIATFSSDFIILDEYAKYRGSFDAAGAARGRQKSYKGMPGYHAIMGIVSSPKRKGDPFYNEIYKGGVLILRFKMPCPRCHYYHELIDANIKEIPSFDGSFDHDPVRIRLDKAAIYECPRCHQPILNDERYGMIDRGVWATDEEEIAQDGHIKNPIALRNRTDSVCYWFNRLVSTPDKYLWSDCLSAFFSSRNNPKAWAIYQNEDAARFLDPSTLQLSQSVLMNKCRDYYQYGDRARIPDAVIILLVGVDSQDDGFYYVIRGFGCNMSSYLIRHGFIECSMNASRFKNPNEVLGALKVGLLKPAYMRNDNTEMGIVFGFMDEGGHRRGDVHYICKHFPALRPYKGASSSTSDPIRRSKTDIHFMGNTRHWSDLVQNYMESDEWFLPKDIGKDYLEQVVGQYNEKKIDIKGNETYEWISGGSDHYRDCENMILAAAHVMNLPEKLNDKDKADAVKVAAEERSRKIQTVQIEESTGIPEKNERVTPFSKRYHQNNPFANRRR
jgi:phage terminase large subunit GpA-like protein